MTAIIETRGLSRTFQVGTIAVRALQGVDLTIRSGEFVSIMGSSGSGKSTLMNLLGCLDTPTEGEYLLDGDRVENLSKNRRAAIRNQKIGFVFQGFNLLARTSALENVELPLFYDRASGARADRQAAVEALARVGLSDRMDHNPSQLSGGQQQRVAIARALVNKPSILLADEPTGNLDSNTTIEVVSLFRQLNEEGVTVILVTHEKDISEQTRRVVLLMDGRVIEDRATTNGRRREDG